MSTVILRKCCKFCKFAQSLKWRGRFSQIKATKRVCTCKDNNQDELKTDFMHNLTHVNGYCDNFEWGPPKLYAKILEYFNNMKREK